MYLWFTTGFSRIQTVWNFDLQKCSPAQKLYVILNLIFSLICVMLTLKKLKSFLCFKLQTVKFKLIFLYWKIFGFRSKIVADIYEHVHFLMYFCKLLDGACQWFALKYVCYMPIKISKEEGNLMLCWRGNIDRLKSLLTQKTCVKKSNATSQGCKMKGSNVKLKMETYWSEEISYQTL